MKVFILLFLLLPSFAKASDSVHVVLGIPSPSVPMQIHTIDKNEFWSGFSCDYGVPLWVSYELNKEWYGEVPRWSGNFIVDSAVTNSCWVRHSDYTNSGYDRGHLVRSEERTRTVEENKSTFKTSNIIPQLPELNQQTWLRLEYYCESLAKESLKQMYIIDGPVFASQPVIMYKDKIGIPDSCYKIVVILDQGQGIADINESTEIIACMFPNNDKDVKNHPWTDYKTSIRHIESSTNLNFLSNLPVELQERLENPNASTTVGDLGKINIYPNPTQSILNVLGMDSFTILNVYGEIIGSYNTKTIDISNFVPGVYFINSTNGTYKFIKI